MHGHVWMRRTGLTVTVAVAIAQAHPAAAGAFPGETSVASVNSAGLAVPGGSGELPFISADGRYVAFFTPGAMTPEDANRRHDVFVRDRTMGLTERASVGNTVLDGNGFSADGSISDDGRFVAFASDSSNLVAGDTNASSDVFVRDRATGTTELVSRSSSGAQANRGAAGPVISGDGRHVAFVASATNLVPGDTNNNTDVFVRDRQTGTTTRVSVSSSGQQTNHTSDRLSISADGRYVAFWSLASTLTAGDQTLTDDVFVHDRQTRTTEMASVSSTGARANSSSFNPALSADGRYVAFHSFGTNLAAGDTNNSSDIFVRDRQARTTTRVSVSSSGAQGDGNSAIGTISADGRVVAFASFASTLVADDTNGQRDIFVHDRATRVTRRASVSSAGTQANQSSHNPRLAASGRFVTFESLASNLVLGFSGHHAYVHELSLPSGAP
jgi:Tol biopolymer transport system component